MDFLAVEGQNAINPNPPVPEAYIGKLVKFVGWEDSRVRAEEPQLQQPGWIIDILDSARRTTYVVLYRFGARNRAFHHTRAEIEPDLSAPPPNLKEVTIRVSVHSPPKR